jgi:hypothetical protein
MERKELYQAVKDRNAYMLFRNLEVELSSAHLDGTNIHGSESLRAVLYSMANLYKMGDFPTTETMSEFKERDKILFDTAMDKVLEAVNNYRVKI